jgi:hypothetical protein
MHPVMNDTKWNEFRLAMHELGELSPKWRSLDLEHGYLCPWDSEWFHHFYGSYRSIQWVELKVDSDVQRDVVRTALARIHVPGEVTESGFKVYGHVADGQAVDYIVAL